MNPKDIADLGAYTTDAKKIQKKSREIVRGIVGDDTDEDRIRQRVVMATGDPSFKDLLIFKNDPIKTGISAICEKKPIFTDVNMAKVGITKCECEIYCSLDYSKGKEKTRTSSGFIELNERLNDGIIVIGNAPSATLTICDLVKKGIKPRLIIATPVGFVNASESKEEVRGLNISSITSIGTRGGSPVAVAIINDIIRMAFEK